MTGIDISFFAKKVDSASLISNVDKLHIDKLKNVPTNLCNLKSKVDKLDVDKLIAVPVETSLNANINEVKGERTSNTNLATKTSLTAVENKIPSVSNLVKKLTITQTLMRFKRRLLIIIMINILLLQNLVI